MHLFSNTHSHGPARRLFRYAVLLTLCGAPFCWAADEVEQVLPPPVPLYSAHVSETSIIGPGMIVIATKDPLDTVLSWYNANLKDQMADVAVGPGHHHYLTHGGAGVDVLAEGTDAKAGTKITLFWKAGLGAATPRKAAEPEPAVQAKNDTPPAAAPKAENPDPSPPVEPIRLTALTFASVAPERAKLAQPDLKIPAIEPVALTPPRVDPAKKPDAKTPADTSGSDAPADGPQGLALFKAGRYAEAMLTWEHAAAAGSVNAALYLGMMFDTGRGAPRNYSEALSWYQLAAEKGSLAGLYNAGVMYDAGFGVPQDTRQAAEFYEKAAAKGAARAAFNLALLYENGDGVGQDDERARKYFRLAERLGVPAARSHLGKSAPQSPSADDDQSFNTVHPIDDGAPAAGSKNAAKAADSIRRLADTGDPAGAYDLAYCYENGIGVEIDLGQAYALYSKAAAGASDGRLRVVATAGATAVKAHLAASRPTPAATP